MTGLLHILAGTSLRIDLRLRRLGFHLWHVGGVSRAWRKFHPDGRCVLITDVGGFDLPGEAGPFVIWQSDAQDGLETDAYFTTDPEELWELLAGPHRHNRTVLEKSGS